MSVPWRFEVENLMLLLQRSKKAFVSLMFHSLLATVCFLPPVSKLLILQFLRS